MGKKRVKEHAYNFNYEKEFVIYRRACGKKLNRREIRMVGDRVFYRYEEWSAYVEKKYQGVASNSLMLV